MTFSPPHPILSMLRQLPPSQELLDFYHQKLEQFEAEESEWLSRLGASREVLQRNSILGEQLRLKGSEVSELQKACHDLRAALHQERKVVAKLYKENDKLRIHDIENRRKLNVLLRLSGKTDEEVSKTVDDDDAASGKRPASTAAAAAAAVNVPERVMKYIENSSGGKTRPMRRTLQAAELELASLEHQLLEQEQCHMEQLSSLDGSRRACDAERRAEADQFERRIAELSNHVLALEARQTNVTEELVKAKLARRKTEKLWLTEKESLTRKLQFLQHYGSLAPTTEGAGVGGGGFFTDVRSLAHLGGGGGGGAKKSERQIQQLNSELAEEKSSADRQRARILAMEADTESLKEQIKANRDGFKRKTKSMVDQVESLKSRHDSLEDRRRKEAEGYAADVQLLRGKLKSVEHQLVRATLNKVKEHGHIRNIRKLETEIEALKKMLKANPEWRN